MRRYLPFCYCWRGLIDHRWKRTASLPVEVIGHAPQDCDGQAGSRASTHSRRRERAHDFGRVRRFSMSALWISGGDAAESGTRLCRQSARRFSTVPAGHAPTRDDGGQRRGSGGTCKDGFGRCTTCCFRIPWFGASRLPPPAGLPRGANVPPAAETGAEVRAIFEGYAAKLGLDVERFRKRHECRRG